ncbi:SCO6880 family protein [Mycetocola reblochoni]|uniref:SCO6880 family protein n=1 Tax=Mycetocola reblochoni TaxID=331618 RepID=UPI003F9E3DEE
MSRTDTTKTGGELIPVKFSRLTRRGLILGLSLSQVIALGIGGVSLVGALYAGGGILVLYSAPIWLLAITLVWVRIGGRALIEWLPVCTWWLWRTTGGQLLYRRRIVTPRPAGTLALPGDMARLREYADPETGAGMIHDPTGNTLTVAVRVTHPAFVLLDPSEQNRRVTAWGRVLATICRSGRISALQVLERTLPDSGQGLAEWWAEHGTHDGSWASTTYAELIDRAGPAGERHATTLSLSLDMRAAARQIRTAGGGIKGAANVLRQEMATLVAALRAADLTPSGWLSTGEIAVMLRTAYDPAIGPTLERHGQLGQDLATAGPVALSTGIQRSISLICTPLRTDQAVRDIRKKKVEHISDQAQRRRIGQIQDASQTAEYEDVLRQEADLTAGHGVLRYTGLIAVTAPTVEELDTAVAAIEQAAIQASCETRLLVGQQAAAFTAAALPLARRI